jgi:predicted RecA/RadA family phage recombinase
VKNFTLTGDNLSFLASQVVAPQHASGDTYTNLVGPGVGATLPVNLVESGDPVVIERIVGVSNMDALFATDTIVISTRGVYALAVQCTVQTIRLGETIYIHPTTAVLSDNSAGVPFGVALGVVQNGATTVINVKLFGQTAGAPGFGS